MTVLSRALVVCMASAFFIACDNTDPEAVPVELINSGTQDVHLFPNWEQMSEANRVSPSAKREIDIEGSLSVTFIAQRPEGVLATVECTVAQDTGIKRVVWGGGALYECENW